LSIPQKKDFPLYKSRKIIKYINLKVKEIRMRNYLDIVKARSSPGILILDAKNGLVYSNGKALDHFPALRKGQLPPEVLDLCRGVRSKSGSLPGPQDSAACLVVDIVSGLPFSLRAFPIAERRSAKAPSYVMVLVEKIVDRHFAELDFDGIGRQHGLSKRETEVLGLISKGLSNSEIAGKLFISEYTVKDHIKKILSKMNVGSRSGIIATLLQPPPKEPGPIQQK
jgi:DNA-binding CsgD family transcriptional regulator